MALSSPVSNATLVRTGVRRGALLLVLSLALSLIWLPAPASAANGAGEAELDFAALINVERAKQGLGALTVQREIVTVARRHSQTMADQQRLHHNPNFSTQITGWQRVSENVGVGPSVSAIHRALMASEGHRRNILDDRVTEVGIGVVISSGRVWVTQNFRRPSSGVQYSAPSTTVFGDVGSNSVHAASITKVASQKIAEPCAAVRFCPAAPVTRGEFATMLVRALDLPATTERHFSDVSGPHAADIEALAAAGLTSGCADGRFCPDRRLSRAQMATFFARALRATPQTSPFDDVGNTHDGAVGALHARGIIHGCTKTTFCPSTAVTRAQTASMLARNLT